MYRPWGARQPARRRSGLRETTAAGLPDTETRPLVGSLRGLYDINYRVLPGGPPESASLRRGDPRRVGT